ncbi:MAG: carbon storage regulator CsrA [Bradymonadia bacterium]
MLTLTRKIGEALCIGDDIKVVVKEIRGKQVRLGIQAPTEIYVCREELYRKIHTANVMAAAGATDKLDKLDVLGGLFARPSGKVAQRDPSNAQGSRRNGQHAAAHDTEQDSTAPQSTENGQREASKPDAAGQEEQSNAG